MVCGFIMVPTVASATSANKKLSPLKHGLAYYRGKTITYIAPTGAGSTYDIGSRAIVKEMSAYLHATINVVNIPSGGTITGQDSLMASPKNGLTIGFLNTGSDYYSIVTSSPGLNFNVARATLLGGEPPATTTCLATQSTSPYPSFGALWSSRTSTPLKVLVTPDAANTEVILFFKALGINFQPISYSSSNTEVTGFLRGDAYLASSGVPQLLGQITSGAAHCLVMFTALTKLLRTTPYYSIVRSVPTIPQVLQKYKPKTAIEKEAAKYLLDVTELPTYAMAAPSGTPSYLVDALQAAARFALTSAYCKTQIKAIGNSPGYETPRAQKTAYVSALNVASQIEAFLR